MSTLMKWLVMLLIWFVFSWAAFQGCVKECCHGSAAETEEVTPPPAETSEITRYPIDFEWGNARAFTNDGYEAMRDRLVSEMQEDGRLVITGLYFDSEPDSLGFARAEQVKAMFAGLIPDDKLYTKAQKLDDMASAKEGYFEGVRFLWETAPSEDEEDVAEVETVNPDLFNIRFPSNSSIKEADPAVDQFLRDLAEQLVSTGENVRLTGYTDNTGTAAGNKTLSERRAKSIRDILIEYGVPRDQITTQGLGPADPVDTNGTPEGRHNNRRVEVKVSAAN